MGKLLLESYTLEGSYWLGKLTAEEFSRLCKTISDQITDEHLEHFVVLLTSQERKKELLDGTLPLYGLSYLFKHRITEEHELETKDGLSTEQKILVLDDLAFTSEGLAHDDGKKIQRLFTHLLGVYAFPRQVGLELCYYKIDRTKFPQQLVLPVIEQDLYYVTGEGLKQ